MLLTPFSSPLYVMAKPVGSHCNLACEYCYYLEKSPRLYHDSPRHVMTDQLLEEFIRQYIEAQTTPEVLFTWHGGEALMRPLSFYQRAVRLQRHYANGRHVDNCLQTNATLLTPEWCRFLHDEGWLVGVSIDGPQEWHDRYRRTPAGKPTYAQVMRGIELLNRYDVQWNAMAVVNSLNVREPLRFYHFFRDTLACHYLQFTPIVERILAPQTMSSSHSQTFLASPDDAEGTLTPHTVAPEAWGDFLCTIFDDWVHHDVGDMFVQIFDATLANRMGVPPGICTLAPDCGHAGVIEYNGDVYSCDHFVFPSYRLGNIQSTSLYRLMTSPKQQSFAKIKRHTLPPQCLHCDVLFACHGECPKNRFMRTPDGHPGLNYLCAGYHRFFTHALPYIDRMKSLLEQQRPPSDIMATL